ncbi:MAG TPA: hypothetical protein P5218_15215, partial [Planctomycetota bacterium]|nr:hypothetical protein [Planctomycetota bacterium]
MLVPSLPILLLSLPLLSLPVHGSSLLQGGDLQSFDGETDGLVASPVWNPNLRPDARGFLGTPFGPVLDLGHVRFSIDHKRTQLGDLRDGTSTVSTEEALAGDYERVPTGGWTGATHLRSEFGLSENATIRLDIPFETRRIAYQFDDGSTQRFTAQGLADIRFQGSVELSFRDQERAELTLGMR